jgi:hypothetical protein
LILTQPHKMVVVMKFFSVFLVLYLAFALTPLQAQPKPGNTAPAAALTPGAAPPPPAPAAKAPTPVESKTNAISKTGLICTVYAGSPSFSALGVRVTVYSTMGTASNCDEATFENLTQASIKAQLRAVQQPIFVIRGGAHNYLMDVNLATLPNPFIRLGNLNFSPVGFVDITLPQLVQSSNLGVIGLSSTEYTPFKLQSQIQYIWNIGRPVHRLVAPNGDRYVMFAFTTQVIKHAQENMLAYLGPLLNKPTGWAYESFLLDKTLTIKTNISDGFGIEILFDDARNMYIKTDD